MWAPEVRPSWRRAKVAARAVEAALADFRVRGFRLAQAVLMSQPARRPVRDLKRGGLPWVTDLLYLERETEQRQLNYVHAIRARGVHQFNKFLAGF